MRDFLDRVREALQFIPVGGHDERFRVACMLKSELGEAGHDLWNEWRGDRGNDEATSVWKSISESGKLTIGTLFYAAKANGWCDDRVHHKPIPEKLAERKLITVDRDAVMQAEIDGERPDTAAMAKAIWHAAIEATADQPYLLGKQLLPVATLREIDAGKALKILGYAPKSKGQVLTGRLLVVPVKQGDRFSTVELIDGRKRKAALVGRGSKSCGYWATERLSEDDGAGLTLLIGEGVATVLSAKQATGYPAIAALSSGNLSAVAKAMRERYPMAALVILADLVRATGEPDPHAIKAAQAVGGKLAVPDFGAERTRDMTDCNDMAVMCGLEAVASVISSASEPSKGESVFQRQVSAEFEQDVNLIRASDLTPEPIAWLWNGWLAAGKMHVFGGAPGTGKTTISMGLAAIVTNGGRWPDGTQSIAGNVVIWSGEDDPADTLIPRLLLSGADLDRVYFIANIRDGDERRSFDPAHDMEPLRRKMADIGEVKLLIIDPIVSAIAGDSHKNTEVRRGLQPLADLAASMRCALLGITHFSKGTGGRDPVERLSGSLAFGALARVVMVAAKYQVEGSDGPTVRLFCRAKSNIGKDEGGFEYDLHQAELESHPGIFASCVSWGEALEGAARELLAAADGTHDGDVDGNVASVAVWLRDLINEEGGKLDRREVMRAGSAIGYKERTIHRAREKVGLIVQQHGFGKHKRSIWIWPNPANTSPFMPILPNKMTGMYGTHATEVCETKVENDPENHCREN